MHYSASKKSRENDSQQFYIESMYAIRLVPPGLYTNTQAKNMPNIILNALVDTLNIKAKVPHTIVIIINDHRFWNDADLLTYQMERILHRFIKEIKRIAEARNTSLPPRAVNWNYPRLFLTRALPLPNNMTRPYPKGFKPNRRRYNRLLQKSEDHCRYTTINFPEFTCDNDNKLFEQDGSISNKGYTQLWATISDAVHKADNQERINMNRARAKQLSAQITLTKEEMKHPFKSEANTWSDIDALPDDGQKATLTKRGAKRGLLEDFDACGKKKIIRNNRPDPDSSPDSTISEYFTSCSQRHHHKSHGQGNSPCTHYKRTTQGKKKCSFKNNWRKQKII